MVQALSAKPRSRIGWKAVSLALNLIVVSIAFFILYRTLRSADLLKVWATMSDTSAWTIVLAGLFVAAGYVTMTLYDYFALRTIERTDVPYRTAALAGFTSYAIGHNMGATALVAGAVRLHIYSAWGLSLVEVAKIAFITGLTFWLGNTFALGLVLTFAPGMAAAVTQLQPWINQTLGCVALTAIVGYLAWLLPAPRALTHRDWRLVLPKRANDASADRHWLPRSRCGGAGVLRASSRGADDRIRCRGSSLPGGDATRLHQPCAGEPWRVRYGDARGLVAIPNRAASGDAADLSMPVLYSTGRGCGRHPRGARGAVHAAPIKRLAIRVATCQPSRA